MLEAAAVPVYALRISKSGRPCHPARLPGALTPQRFWPPARPPERPLPRVALSLRQPWAWLVASGLKPVENRTWRTTFRGPFLIHAGSSMTRADYDACVAFSKPLIGRFFPPFEAFARGGIVGAAKLKTVWTPYTGPEGETWRMTGQYGFAVADAEVLPFVRSKGTLGFYRITDADYQRVARRVQFSEAV
ncbi:MAG: ASCH domain-containing protein [Gammaproteobacteria bacterium]|nr:ASCH domain-containing protein [Gammaproteobacteria bacterium]NIR83748.1 ASCH domain-containing protein [Gammaproteobacteria bacterium]NIU05054.1 ASCH domain-containing protein [Gammaproteobacteria bacterium]NIV51910.1 ASCH domain-containing protein [Gammaproteobacteria bacterium]NIX86327.1 ASCH domain-containing protein [Gammaproteobacteria bacterium]